MSPLGLTVSSTVVLMYCHLMVERGGSMSSAKGSQDTRRHHDGLQQLLLNDNMITPDVMAQCSRLLDTAPYIPRLF